MKRKLILKSLLILPFLVLSFISTGQEMPPKLKAFINEQLVFEKAQNVDWKISSEHFDKERGVHYYYLQQTINKLPIFNAIVTIAVKNEGYYLSANRSVDIENTQITTPTISSSDAINFAAQHLGIDNGTQPHLLESSKTAFIYRSEVSLEDIPVELVYFVNDGNLELAWNLSIAPSDQEHWWSLRIDATTGDLLNQTDWVTHCIHPEHTSKSIHNNETAELLMMPPPPGTDQYNVFALPLESPNHGSRSILVGPYDNVASPFGWHDDNGIAGEEYTITQGNNVHAYEDANDDNQPGYSPDGGTALNFDFPLNLNQPAQNYWDAAITNLFYMNNMMHDIWYHYGFDEASGNFQENNYGNGGSGSDYVRAEAQDGGGSNNANFATPPDGNNPRMQMYLWDAVGSSDLLTVNSPGTIAGTYTAIEAGFGPPVPVTPITSDIVIFNDGVPDEYDACEAPINGAQFANKIVLIRRGSCTFVSKIEFAQNNGAAAVIMVNNVATAPITMGGTGGSITIPSVMISQADGNSIISIIENGGTVNATLQNNGPFENDGDFDNGIIAHEYGHGISNRLTGGGNNTDCLGNSEQMGEGWSDFFGLMLTIEPGDQGTDVRGIGTYAINEPTTGDGIRPAPYSTSFTVNNFTYAATNNTGSISQPHGIGFVWCTMLWDMNWALIDQYGFDPDLHNGTGGNNMAMELVMMGLKLQPCEPGFVDGRDAILQADQLLYNGANQCLIWEVFANRGLGFSASQGSSNSRSDQTEAFDLPPTMNPATTFVTECSSYTWSANGQTYTSSGVYTDTVNNPNCIQVVTLDLTIVGQVNTTVTQVNPSTAQANHTGSGVTYQWVDCNNNNAPLSGQTQSTLTNIEGNFAVIINDNGCIDTSDCVTLISNGISEELLSNVNVYPNPTKGNITVELEQTYSNVKFVVYDLNGRVIIEKQANNINQQEIELKAAPGAYILEIEADGNKKTKIPLQVIE